MSEPMGDFGPLSGNDGQPKGALGKFWRWLSAGALGKLFRSLAILGVLAAVVGGLLANDGVYRGGDLKSRKASLEEENLRLEEENRQLMSRIERFGQDPVFLEDEARRKLRLVRPDEIIYRLAEEPDLSDGEAAEMLQ
jgi:cell division protein FtsB